MLFEGKAGCAACHPAPYYTDQKMHNVGILTPLEPDGSYDTPVAGRGLSHRPVLSTTAARPRSRTCSRRGAPTTWTNAPRRTPDELIDLVAFLRIRCSLAEEMGLSARAIHALDVGYTAIAGL